MLDVWQKFCDFFSGKKHWFQAYYFLYTFYVDIRLAEKIWYHEKRRYYRPTGMPSSSFPYALFQNFQQ